MPLLLLALAYSPSAQAAPGASKLPTYAEVLAQATAEDWAPIPPENLLVLRVAGREVVIELAPGFAPKNVKNLRVLVSEGYSDGLAVVRSQDNYVVQWADPAQTPEAERPLGSAKGKVGGEFDRPLRTLSMFPLPDQDAYASQVGFVDGFPAGSDGKRIWLTHCYGMVGVARGDAANSGNGSSLYVVTGHAPRHLDRNITLVGRVIHNVEVLSALPRGSGAMGFYEGDDALVPLESVRLVSDLPAAERPQWYRLRTDTARFEALVESRRNRQEGWFHHQAGGLGVCNVPLPRSAEPPSP